MKITTIPASIFGKQLYNFAYFVIGLSSVFNPADAANLYMDKAMGGFKNTAYVDCKIGGFQTKCLLDSGSAFPVVTGWSKYLDDQKVIRQEQVTGADGTDICDVLSIGGIAVGALNFGPQEVRRCKGYPLPSPNIGLKVFNNRSFTLDFRNQQLIWNQPGGLSGKTIHRLNRDEASGWIVLDIKIGDKTMSAFFDTGSQLSIVDNAYAAAHPEIFKPLFDVGTVDGTGHSTREKLYAIEPITIDGNVSDSYASRVVMGSDLTALRETLGPNTHMILGLNNIKDMTWSFDLKNELWTVAKSEEQVVPTAP